MRCWCIQILDPRGASATAPRVVTMVDPFLVSLDWENLYPSIYVLPAGSTEVQQQYAGGDYYLLQYSCHLGEVTAVSAANTLRKVRITRKGEAGMNARLPVLHERGRRHMRGVHHRRRLQAMFTHALLSSHFLIWLVFAPCRTSCSPRYLICPRYPTPNGAQRRQLRVPLPYCRSAPMAARTAWTTSCLGATPPAATSSPTRETLQTW